MSATGDNQGTSTRPYLLRALHDWCTDNGFTPYIAVHVDASVQVPMEYVKNNEIVLNVGFEATSGLKLGNEFIEFKARFGGVSREIVVPVDHVVAIYARENGQGMAFPMPAEGAPRPGAAAPEPAPARGLRLASTEPPADEPAGDGDEPPPEPAGPGAGRPALKRIK
ncbi:MAG: ClpXP protease specificity-enhancing factor [Rubrivivax sp.]|nr:ClpXP protease specificity-enhancing factor [Rubrivivax sp.]MCW5613230.1 ClpXP protease specificity-enhancing factor [Rubrivivax sp.]